MTVDYHPTDSCNVHVPILGRRLYTISRRHDGGGWFVMVGKTLTGRRPVWKGRKKTEEIRPIEVSAFVLAVFPANDLCWVATDNASLLEGGSKG
jgi:hypothetical protein